MFCVRETEEEVKLGEEKQHRHSGACTTKYTKINGINIACADVSLTVVQGCPCSKLEKEKQRQIDILVKSRNKSLEEMQQIKTSICYYVGLQWHVQVCSGSPPFLYK